MATLTDSISSALTPQTLGTIGKKIGVDEVTMQQGMDAAVPAVLGSLSKTASSAGGLDDIMNQLPQGAGGADPLSSILGGLLGGSSGAPAAGATGGMGDLGPLGGLMGPAIGVVGTVISKKLGFDISPILTMGVPIVLGAISSAAKKSNLDKAGVSKLIQDENSELIAKGGSNVDLVQEAFATGDKALAIKAKFTADAWTNVRLAPLAVAKLVIESSKSNPIAMAQELAAGASAVTDTVRGVDPGSAIGFAFNTGPSDEDSAMVQKATAGEAQGMIRDAVAAVAKNTPGEADAYRAMLLNVGQKTAEAAKEGGFLGIGGTKVSKEEQATLDEIKRLVSA